MLEGEGRSGLCILNPKPYVFWMSGVRSLRVWGAFLYQGLGLGLSIVVLGVPSFRGVP